MSRTVPTVLACDESNLLSVSCMTCFPAKSESLNAKDLCHISFVYLNHDKDQLI